MNFRLERFTSTAMGEEREYGVILPPGYASHPEKRYPVVVLLHGGHDDARAWHDKIGIVPVLQQLYAANKLPPVIVITPNGKMGTLSNAASAAILGHRGAVVRRLGGVEHRPAPLDPFNIFFSQIGYFKDRSGPENSPQEFITRIPAAQRQKLRIYMDAGLNDLTGPQMLTSTRAFAAVLNRLGVPYVKHEFPGGHGLSGADYGWNYDHKHALDSLSYVGEHLQAALKHLGAT